MKKEADAGASDRRRDYMAQRMIAKNYAAGDAGEGLRLLVEKAVAGVGRKVVGELSDHF